MRRTANIVLGHVSTNHIHPTHCALVRVLEHVAVKHLTLPYVGRPKSDPTSTRNVIPRDGVVKLALLQFAATTWGDHHGMVQMLVERVDLGTMDGPLMHLVVGNGSEGGSLVPRDTIDATCRHVYLPSILARNERLPEARQ